MTTRTTPFAPGTPCWVDLGTSDAAKSKQFYGELLGWQFMEDTDGTFGGYIVCISDGEQVAGIMPVTDEMRMGPDGFNTYLATTDIEASVAAATAAGATVYAPAMAVADLGSMAILGDTSGGVFGFWQADKHIGFGKYNAPSSVSWNEYHSRSLAQTVEFYRQVCDWEIDKMSDTDEFRYYLAKIDGHEVAGVMDSSSFLPEGHPGGWGVYFSVENADAAQAKAIELGGTVIRSAEDSPYGRIAQLLDSTGAEFRLHQMSAGMGG